MKDGGSGDALNTNKTITYKALVTNNIALKYLA